MYGRPSVIFSVFKKKKNSLPRPLWFCLCWETRHLFLLALLVTTSFTSVGLPTIQLVYTLHQWLSTFKPLMYEFRKIIWQAIKRKERQKFAWNAKFLEKKDIFKKSFFFLQIFPYFFYNKCTGSKKQKINLVWPYLTQLASSLWGYQQYNWSTHSITRLSKFKPNCVNPGR